MYTTILCFACFCSRTLGTWDLAGRLGRARASTSTLSLTWLQYKLELISVDSAAPEAAGSYAELQLPEVVGDVHGSARYWQDDSDPFRI